jgi:dihydroorotate dehydrogenase (NAD+) catalytic subunit
VQVGTATFYDPAAPVRIVAEIDRWCRRHGVDTVASVVGSLGT